MIKTKKIQGLIPTGETVYSLSKIEIKDAFLKIIEMYTIEALKHQMYVGTIREGLSRIKDIRIRPNMSLKDIVFTKNGVLYLPEFFFKRELNSQEDITEMLDEYPILKELLCAYGVYAVGVRPHYDDSKDYEVKKLLAHYFARQSFTPTMEKVHYAGKVFNSYGNIYTLEDNIFAELEAIFDEKILVDTLRLCIFFFNNEVQKYTGKNGIGQELLNGIIELSKLTSKEDTLTAREATDKSIKRKLLKPLYERSFDYEPQDQRKIANKLTHRGFEIQKVGKYLGIDFRDFTPLSEYEIDTIKLYILDFKRKLYELRPFWFTSYPQVTPTREFMEVQDFNDLRFTDLNRIMTMMNANAHEKDVLDTEILELWNKLQKLIVKVILPKSLDPNSNIRMTRGDFRMIADLSTYQDKHTGKTQSSVKTHQIQKLSEKNWKKKVN